MDTAALILKARTSFAENVSLWEDWKGPNLDYVYNNYAELLKRYGIKTKAELEQELINFAHEQNFDMDKVARTKDKLVTVVMRLVMATKAGTAKEVPAPAEEPVPAEGMSHEARELYTYILNKVGVEAAGYSADNSTKALVPMVSRAANAYAKEYGGKATEIFKKSDITAVAKKIADDYVAGKFNADKFDKPGSDEE